METCNEKNNHFVQPPPSNNAELTGQQNSTSKLERPRMLSATSTTTEGQSICLKIYCLYLPKYLFQFLADTTIESKVNHKVIHNLSDTTYIWQAILPKSHKLKTAGLSQHTTSQPVTHTQHLKPPTYRTRPHTHRHTQVLHPVRYTSNTQNTSNAGLT